MIRTRTRRAIAGAFALLATGGTAAAAVSQDAPSFKEFSASTYRDADHVYVVNGDEPIDNRSELRDYYNNLVGAGRLNEGLIVNKVNGVADTWTATQARNLTYCVSTKFRTKHDAVVKTMAAASAQWENASSGVNFIYDGTQDGSCTTANRNVVFSVEPTRTTQYIARAFFPSSPKSNRNILVNPTSLYGTSGWPAANILAHEQGHILGFRHEHTRPEAGTCFEDNNWIPLTPYDSSSIMHYPQCNGTSTNLSMTATDREGVRKLYG